MAKTKVKSLRKLDTKTALILGAGAAVLGFFVYNSLAATDSGGDPIPQKTYKYNSTGIKHDRGSAVEDPDWAFKVWRSTGFEGSGTAWRGPNAAQKKGKYTVCFYTEKEAGGADNGIEYSVWARIGSDKRLLTVYEGPTGFDWQRKKYWRDCLQYQLTRDTNRIEWTANPYNGTFDVAKVEIYKGYITPPNSTIHPNSNLGS